MARNTVKYSMLFCHVVIKCHFEFVHISLLNIYVIIKSFKTVGGREHVKFYAYPACLSPAGKVG